MYIKRLADWVAIQSVSSAPSKRDEVVRMVKVAAKVRMTLTPFTLAGTCLQ